MKAKRAGDAVRAGFYFNFRTWEIHLHKTHGAKLPGGADERYARVPAVALLVLGPVMGFFFVIFLPLIGFALVAREIGRRLWGLAAKRAGEPKPKLVRH
jgi:hypothetical protein